MIDYEFSCVSDADYKLKMVVSDRKLNDSLFRSAFAKATRKIVGSKSEMPTWEEFEVDSRLYDSLRRGLAKQVNVVLAKVRANSGLKLLSYDLDRAVFRRCSSNGMVYIDLYYSGLYAE